MSTIAVLTGDLVNSTRVRNAVAFQDRLNALLTRVAQKYTATFTTFRGDGFQITLPNAGDAFETCLYLRSGLISQSPTKSERWDARMAVAIGSDKPAKGAAHQKVFIQSGQALDAMKGRNLVIIGQTENFTLAANITSLFLDDLIAGWTPTEAEVLFEYLQAREGHKIIAQRLGKKRPTVTLSLQRARYQLIEHYIQDMQKILDLPHEH